jgi:hypothetical protein
MRQTSPHLVTNQRPEMEFLALLREQNQLLRVLVQKQTQHDNSLANWKMANPELSERCYDMLPLLDNWFKEYLGKALDELETVREENLGSEYQINDFLLSFVPRVQQLQTITTLFKTLGTK